MSRLMSVAMTADAVIERRKTVTRRKGWWLDKNGRRLLHVGDTLTLCRKVQGRKPGEPIERLAEVEVVSVRREPLCAIAGPYAYDGSGGLVYPEVVAEGFLDMHPAEFMERFFVPQGVAPMDEVTRIEWRYLDDADADKDYAEYVDEQNVVGMSADPWGIGLAAITLPDCETCHDTGEVGDGYTREYDTGAWVTWPCPDCTYPTRTPA